MQPYDENTDPNIEQGDEAACLSPTAPRFCKETQRGAKRSLDIVRFNQELQKRKMVQQMGINCATAECVCRAFVLVHVFYSIFACITLSHALQRTAPAVPCRGRATQDGRASTALYNGSPQPSGGGSGRRLLQVFAMTDPPRGSRARCCGNT